MQPRRKDTVSVTLTIRMTCEDRELLDRLVNKRALELSDEGLSVTATSVIRGMIRREARSLGLLPSLGTPAELGTLPPPHVPSPSPSRDQDACAPLSAAEAPSVANPLRRQTGDIPVGNPTPMVPTGMSEPRALRPCHLDMPDSDEGGKPLGGLDAEDTRERAVRAIRARRFRQHDLVERARVPQRIVSRFLLGAETTEARLRAIAEALEALDG